MLGKVLADLDDEDIMLVDEPVANDSLEINKKMSKLDDDFKCPTCHDIGTN